MVAVMIAKLSRKKVRRIVREVVEAAVRDSESNRSMEGFAWEAVHEYAAKRIQAGDDKIMAEVNDIRRRVCKLEGGAILGLDRHAREDLENMAAYLASVSARLRRIEDALRVKEEGDGQE